MPNKNELESATGLTPDEKNSLNKEGFEGGGSRPRRNKE